MLGGWRILNDVFDLTLSLGGAPFKRAKPRGAFVDFRSETFHSAAGLFGCGFPAAPIKTLFTPKLPSTDFESPARISPKHPKIAKSRFSAILDFRLFD
jgi:hypothetical protein